MQNLWVWQIFFICLFLDDGCSPETEIPFHLLSGESPWYIGLYKGGSHFVVLTNYRFFATCDSGFFSIPVGVVELVETQYSSDLILLCKDGRNIRLVIRWKDKWTDSQTNG